MAFKNQRHHSKGICSISQGVRAKRFFVVKQGCLDVYKRQSVGSVTEQTVDSTSITNAETSGNRYFFNLFHISFIRQYPFFLPFFGAKGSLVLRKFYHARRQNASKSCLKSRLFRSIDACIPKRHTKTTLFRADRREAVSYTHLLGCRFLLSSA